MTQPMPSTQMASLRRWLDPRVLGVGAGSGLLGALCCIAGAIAVGSGLGGLSFAGTLMDRYQPYFITVSVLMMAWWLLRTVRVQSQGMAGDGLVALVRRAARPVALMGAAYAPCCSRPWPSRGF